MVIDQLVIPSSFVLVGRMGTHTAEGPTIKTGRVAFAKNRVIGVLSIRDCQVPFQEKVAACTTSPVAHAKLLGVAYALARPTNEVGLFPLVYTVVSLGMGRRQNPRRS
jgi:hypothetical protein